MSDLPQIKSRGLPDRPEEFGPALAHVIRQEGTQDVVLGQTWIAGANILVTCGHVVDQYVQNPGQLQVQFLASGNRYPVRGIRLHPSFVRQVDQLVKFDVAILFVDLGYPEREANPLPIRFEKTLTPQEALSAVRYPAHLGPLSGSPNPLAQLGRYLGPLRKHDNFHLLHDLALSPGDSGAPIFDGVTVVAIHCGDTATLPGLNLPTTAIRLALWVDALRDLGVNETYFPIRKNYLPMTVWASAAAFLLAFVAASFLLVQSNVSQWTIKDPEIAPVDVSFNKPLHDYTTDDTLSITLLPRSTCYLYLFYVDNKDSVRLLYPPSGEEPFVQANSSRIVDRLGETMGLSADTEKGKLHLVALKSVEPLLRDTDFADEHPADNPLKINGHTLETIIRKESLKIQPISTFNWTLPPAKLIIRSITRSKEPPFEDMQMNRLNELILASAAVCTLAGAAVAADPGSNASGMAEPTSAGAKPSAKEPAAPTADEQKTSSDRGIRGVPLLTVPPTSPSKVESSPTMGIFSQPVRSNVVLVKKKTQQTRSTHTATLAKSKPVASASGNKSLQVVATKKPTVTAANHEPGNIKPAVYNTTSQSIVKVWLNKTGTTPRYRSGENMEINVSASKDCNLMIFDFDGRGKLTQLFPNQFQQGSAVKAGETVAIGGENSSFAYTVSLPKGREQSDEKIFVYAYPLNENGNAPISVAMNTTDSVFRSAEMTLEQYRKLVNESKVFFARDVQITPRQGAIDVASAETTQAPNKYELGFVIEK